MFATLYSRFMLPNLTLHRRIAMGPCHLLQSNSVLCTLCITLHIQTYCVTCLFLMRFAIYLIERYRLPTFNRKSSTMKCAVHFMICYIHLAKLSIFLLSNLQFVNFLPHSFFVFLYKSTYFSYFFFSVVSFFPALLLFLSALNAIVELLSIFLQFILLPLPFCFRCSFLGLLLIHSIFHSLSLSRFFSGCERG